MKIIIYMCDLCKKRIRKNQKVWFQGDGSEYHFKCKYRQEFLVKARPLQEFLS